MIWIIIAVGLQLLNVSAQGQEPYARPTKRPPYPRPKKPPTKTPVKSGSPSKPKKPPTKTPYKPSKVPTQTSVAKVLVKAKAEISAVIAADPPIAATFLRLIFHDCVPEGDAKGCDGCLNMDNTKNEGLQPAIQSLAPIVAEFENKSLGISRADLWAYAALVAAERSQSTVVFTDNFRVGRKNCETVGTCTLGPKSCTTKGPDTENDFPSDALTTKGLINFMEKHFGYNEDQTVAIMGAHSIGKALPENSGYQGAWDSSPLVLDNNYYRAIVGSPDPVRAPNWVQIDARDGKVQWARHSEDKTTLMLITDIAIVRNLADEFDNNRKVKCSFRDMPAMRTCPLADTLAKASEYRNDNDLWLADFEKALKILVEKGLE